VELYGCFSPRVADTSSLPVSSTIEGAEISEVMAPVLQIMPELRELGTVTDLPPTVAHVKVDVPATMCLPEQSHVAHTPIPSPPPHSPDALFAEEICDLLSKLDVAIPGLGRSIACLLTGTAIKGKNKKVGDGPRTGVRKEKSLRRKDNKNVSIEKALAAT
jgi:hypothetical protein